MTDNVKEILQGIGNGMKDAFAGTLKIYSMDSELSAREEKVRKKREEWARLKGRPPPKKEAGETRILFRIIQCCTFNGGVFWCSIAIFNNIVLPLLEKLTYYIVGDSAVQSLVVWSWLGPMLSYTFSALWVIPLFLLSKIVNSLWFQDIGDLAYRKSRGRPQMLGLSTMVADLLFSIVIQAIFLIQAMFVGLIPLSGMATLLSLFHLCLLYSLYAFEYKWFNMGWEVHKRIHYIESNWPYFVGFGLPLAVCTYLPQSQIVSGCVFSMLFPLFIISANEARPPRQLCEKTIRVFHLSVELANKIFHKTMRTPKSATDQSTGTVTTSISLSTS
ncbi:etoposide-induced protein 2.4-like [Saccoglossus kowalevskii]|uniref:Etoposide-induced protein 2.4-like n=1 Tax=Saccoglossus kowalevskii TaxID=10224 RepID=A0ABM0GYN6_SACKO|nr:PREDICTED: etoposide-induced protein 2.4-like [Saccoglossus kowalevskii]